MAALSPQEIVFRAQRRAAVARNPSFAGLDSIAVRRGPAAPEGGGQELWLLELQFVPALEGGVTVPRDIARDKVRITLDGVPDPDLRVEAVDYPAAPGGQVTVTVRRRRGREPAHDDDAAVYRLELVGVGELDPFFTAAGFRFVPGEPGEVISRLPHALGRLPDPTDIDYLAKDYDSFRALMLERMSVLVPEWTERNPSDLGVALVELLAYVGDYLSYRQDAVATEAYLRTARRRVSVRRHARLLDYRLHEGCNARVWAHLEVSRPLHLPAGVQLLTRSGALPKVVPSPSRQYLDAMASGVKVFETAYPIDLEPDLNRLVLYTWGAEDFQLRAGATEAAVAGTWVELLQPGAVVIFIEVLGPETGEPSGADPHHRHAVRLTEVRGDRDELEGYDITRIGWSEEDALPFPLTVSVRLGSRTVTGASVVLGNVVLADHGRSMPVQELEPVPAHGPYRPVLRRSGITYRQRLPEDSADLGAATTALTQDPCQALPQIALYSYPEHSIIPPEQRYPPRGERWQPRWTLLNSGRFGLDFSVEQEDDRIPRLRFGDNLLGARPMPGSVFKAIYRLGNGAAGNLGPGVLGHLAIHSDWLSALHQASPALHRGDGPFDPDDALEALDEALVRVVNPLPAEGGVEAESIEAARVNAPQAFRTQARCVIEADYVAIAERHPEVAAAACQIVWTGSWPTAFVYPRRSGGEPVSQGFCDLVAEHMQPYLVAGTDLEVRPPRWVPLSIVLRVEIGPGCFRERLRQELEEVFSSDEGGMFDPDRFTFGQPVYLSEVVAAAAAVDGVVAVRVEAFHRWGEPPGDEIETGVLPIGPLEIARVATDPNAPQLGTVELLLEGGR